MESSHCMYEAAVNGLLDWRKENDMPATVAFYQSVLNQSGHANFAQWAKPSEKKADMSLFMLNKKMSNTDILSSLEGFDTIEKRVKFLEDNIEVFLDFANERYCPYVVTLDQLTTLIELGNTANSYFNTLDDVIVLAVTNMSMSYRHYVFHFLNSDGSSNHTDAKGNLIVKETVEAPVA